MRTPTEDPAAGAPPGKSGRGSWFELPAGMTPRHARNLVILTVLGVAGALAFEFVLNRFVHIRPESVQKRVETFGAWAPLVYVIALAITEVVTPIPSLPLDIAGGLAFGLWKGTGYILAGAMLGATADFYIARLFGRGLLERHLRPSVLALIDGLAERIGGKALFVMRIEPLFNFKWVSYAAGLTRMSYAVYAVATLLGTFLPALGIAYVGATLLSHPGRSALVFSLLSLLVVVPLVAAGLIGAGIVVKRRRRRRA